MRVLTFVLSLLVTTALSAAGVVAIVTTRPDDVGALIALPTVAVSLLIYGPLFLGSVRAYWSFAGSRDTKRYFARMLIVVIGVEALAAVAVVVYSIVAAVPLWLPVSFIGVGAVLTVVALVVGRSLQRREERLSPYNSTTWMPLSHRAILGKIRKVVITFVVTLFVGFVILTVLNAALDRGAGQIGAELLIAIGLAFIAAGFACTLVSIPIARMVRESAGRDVSVVQKVAKVVLRHKPIDLDDRETVAASRYASVMTYYFPFQFAQILLLYIGIGLQQVQSLVGGYGSALNGVVLGLYVLLLAVLAPVSMRRFRRARAYAREHTDLLPSADEPSASHPA